MENNQFFERSGSSEKLDRRRKDRGLKAKSMEFLEIADIQRPLTGEVIES